MGEVKATFRLSNPLRSEIPPLEVEALVDSGAVMSLFGRDIVDKLGLELTGRSVVQLADDSTTEMERAGPLRLEWGDPKSAGGHRASFFECLVGEPAVEPLVGQLVLEALDLIVDCPRQRLTVRPESPAYPLHKLK